MKFDKLIITAAICGAELTRKDTPYLPITPEELSDEAKKCYDAGASIVHIHVRDEEGNPSQDAQIFKKTVSLVREKAPELIVQVSTGGATWMSAEERLQSLESNPDMATLSTGTSNFGNDVFMNTRSMIMKFAKVMKSKNIMPEFECFELGHVSFANKIVKKGLFGREHYHYDFVMGVPGAIEGSVPNLVRMVQEIPEDCSWCVAGVGGKNAFTLAATSIAMGGHVRIGMEDNIYLSKGVVAKSNADLVERVVRISESVGREIAKPNEVKEYFGL